MMIFSHGINVFNTALMAMNEKAVCFETVKSKSMGQTSLFHLASFWYTVLMLLSEFQISFFVSFWLHASGST
jgi:hypothetical protein